MNTVILFPEDFVDQPNVVRLCDRRHQHILKIHKAQCGDRLSIALLNEKLGMGQITAINHECVEMVVEFFQDPPSPLPAHLIVALPRPLVLKRFLISATSLGVKKIFFIQTRRVEKSFWQSPTLSESNIREQLILGLEQCKDSLLPKVFFRRNFSQFINDELPSLQKDRLCLLAHPNASRSCPKDVGQAVTLMMGPEGGFIDREVEQITQMGFQHVGLGERILRVEAAMIALLSKLF